MSKWAKMRPERAEIGAPGRRISADGAWSSSLSPIDPLLRGGFQQPARAVVAKMINRRHQVDLLSLTAWQGLLGSIPLLIIAVASGSKIPTWSSTFVWALVYSIVLANALAGVLWLYVLRKLPSNQAGMGSLATIGVVSAWIVLGERPDVPETIGMALIVLVWVLSTCEQVAPSLLRRVEWPAWRNRTVPKYS